MEQNIAQAIISLMIVFNCNSYFIDPELTGLLIPHSEISRYPDQAQNVTLNQILGSNFETKSCSSECSRHSGYVYFDYSRNVLNSRDTLERLREIFDIFLVVKVLPFDECSEIRWSFGSELEEQQLGFMQMFICKLCDDPESNKARQQLSSYIDSHIHTLEFELTKGRSSELNCPIRDQSSSNNSSDWPLGLLFPARQPLIDLLLLKDFCPHCLTSGSSDSSQEYIFGLHLEVLLIITFCLFLAVMSVIVILVAEFSAREDKSGVVWELRRGSDSSDFSNSDITVISINDETRL